MLRASVLLLLAAVLAGSSLALSWGEKSVVYEECRLDVERGARVCHVQEVRASYDPTALRGRSTWTQVVDGEVEEPVMEPFWHPYDGPARDGASWWASPVLPWARPLLVAAAVVATLSVAAAGTLGRRAAWTGRTSWAPLATGGVMAAAVLASLGGVALHALSWSASRVEPLRPVPGTWVLVAAGLAGVAGGLRMHLLLQGAAEGRTGSSPLVPAEELYGFVDEEPEPDPEEPGGRARTSLRWPAGGALAVAAALLLLLPLGVPLATKQITLQQCFEDEARGFVCFREPLSVAYHAAHASMAPAGEPASASELLDARGPHYFGAFQAAHGGPAWMGLGAVLSLLGGAGTVAWLAVAASSGASGAPPAARLRSVTASLLVGGFLLSLLGIAVQASAWVGAPAGRSRPAAGLVLGIAGLLVLTVWQVRLLRARRAQEGSAGPTTTATPTSGAG